MGKVHFILPMYAQQPQDITPRLVDLVDRLSQRIPSTQLDPSVANTSQFNTGIFAPQQQAALQRQEMALRQPNVGAVSPQQFQSINNYINGLQQVAYLGSQYAIMSESMLRQCDSLHEAAMIGGHAIQLLSLSMKESDSLREVIAVLQAMLHNPYYLLTQAFDVWAQTLTADDTGFIELLSEAYIRLVSMFEENRRQHTGAYTPQYTGYLQSQIDNNYQSPSATYQGQGQGLASALKQLSSRLQSQSDVSVGRQIQRQHAAMRQGGT